MINKTIILLFLTICFFTISHVEAQNESAAPEGWQDSLSIGVGFEWMKGYSDYSIYNYSFEYSTIFENQWNLTYNLEGRYGETDKKLSHSNHMMGLNIERIFFDGFFSLMNSDEMETDPIQNIYFRIVAGFGPKITFLREWWINFYVYSLPAVDHTRIDDTLERETYYRLKNNATLIISFTQEFANSITFEFNHLPRIDNFDDYRSDGSVTLRLSIIENLSLENTYKVEYVSHPLESEDSEIEKTNYSNTMSVILSY